VNGAHLSTMLKMQIWDTFLFLAPGSKSVARMRKVNKLSDEFIWLQGYEVRFSELFNNYSTIFHFSTK
jgi:hypothetical protein